MSEQSTHEQEPKRQRSWTYHIRTTRRSLVPVRVARYTSLCSRTLAWIVPWGFDDYPGIGRACVEVFAHKVGLEAVRAWRRGMNPMPDWAARMLADYLRSRLAAGQALLSELEAYRAPVRKRSGVCVVDPVTGRDGRNRTGRRKPKHGPQTVETSGS